MKYSVLPPEMRNWIHEKFWFIFGLPIHKGKWIDNQEGKVCIQNPKVLGETWMGAFSNQAIKKA